LDKDPHEVAAMFVAVARGYALNGRHHRFSDGGVAEGCAVAITTVVVVGQVSHVE
jgi:hypothetical protein